MGRATHIFTDGEIKLKYLCYSEFQRKEIYLGLSETTFKERYRNHKKESNHSKY